MTKQWLLTLILGFWTAGLIEAEDAKKAPSLDGVWTVVMVEYDSDKSIDKDLKRGDTFTVNGTDYRLDGSTHKERGTLKTDDSMTPATVDLADGNKQVSRAIYKLDGDKLVLCLWPGERPTVFKSGPKALLVEFERKK